VERGVAEGKQRADGKGARTKRQADKKLMEGIQ